MTEETDIASLQDNTEGNGVEGSADQNKQSTESSTIPAGDQSTVSGTQEAAIPGKEGNKSEGTPEAYSAFTLPEGMTMNQSLLDAFLPIAQESGMTQEAVQSVVSAYTKQIQTEDAAQVKAIEDQVNEWVGQARKHAEYGGDKFEDSLKISDGIIDKFFNKEAIKFLNDSYVGSHPDIWAGIVNVGTYVQTLENQIKELTGEDEFIQGDNSRGGGSKNDQETKLNNRYPTMKEQEN